MYYEPSHEGLDRVQAIRYYSRMQILLTVAPLLQKSSSPRVVTVLGAGKEGQLWADDLYLKDHYSLPNAAGASASMMTLFLEEFQKQPGNAKISFVHLYPGLVGGTGLTIKGLPGWAQVLVDWIATPLMRWFGYSVEEAGERVLYAATSPMFPAKDRQGREEAERGSDGGKGSGVYLAQGDSTVVPGNKVLSGLREDEMGTKVWDHTNKIFSSVQRS
ncbi:uncharacterized protein BDR25DRAFT_303289 [Lindgomyces ingoldianus]|uniref:Uncharacterized protein n=1 Tax=Lindgomyces ingoldianus TaxID=673940 RepID=A0ACB6QVV2_9PLEO|nr:uncharacterized protein BDR25DRAFT_303289 [Lindgomyces ingoldianus]KAF2471169.1 hypothetical protein BDR25DRAFT_303289 [Lindgomyces ingoldianus]